MNPDMFSADPPREIRNFAVRNDVICVKRLKNRVTNDGSGNQ